MKSSTACSGMTKTVAVTILGPSSLVAVSVYVVSPLPGVTVAVPLPVTAPTVGEIDADNIPCTAYVMTVDWPCRIVPGAIEIDAFGRDGAHRMTFPPASYKRQSEKYVVEVFGAAINASGHANTHQ